MPAASPRIDEVDALRGIGIAAVVLFHFFFDLHFLGLSAQNPYEGPYLVLQRFAASTMLVTAGVSLALSRASAEAKSVSFVHKAFQRFLFLAGVAALITLATWIYPNKGFIVFGIIHFMALSTLLALPFARLTWPNLGLAILLFLAEPFVRAQTLDTPWLLWLGLQPKDFFTFDYFPIIPWFGLVLLCIFAGNRYFLRGHRLLRGFQRFPEPLLWLGRKSLLVYLLHQPILLTLLTIYKLFLAG